MSPKKPQDTQRVKGQGMNHYPNNNQPVINTPQEGTTMTKTPESTADITPDISAIKDAQAAIEMAEQLEKNPGLLESLVKKLSTQAPGWVKQLGGSEMLELNKRAGLQVASQHVGRIILNNATNIVLGILPESFYNWLSDPVHTYRMVGFKFLVGQLAAAIIMLVAGRMGGNKVLEAGAQGVVYAATDTVFESFGLERLINSFFPKDLQDQLAGELPTM